MVTTTLENTPDLADGVEESEYGEEDGPRADEVSASAGRKGPRGRWSGHLIPSISRE